MSTENTAPVELMICLTCRTGSAGAEDDTRPGTLLYEQLKTAELGENITITGVECLSNCNRGCTIAVRGGETRWTYVYGNFEPQDSELVEEGILKYSATADGLVPWRERPEHFRKNCIARIPPMEIADEHN